MAQDILPPNATPLERMADMAMPAWEPVVGDFKTPSEGESPSFLPWYAAQWGLADFADHFPDAGTLVEAGVPWLLERGTAAAVMRALGWMGLDTATLDEDGAYLHIDLGRSASNAELLAVARLVRPSIPAHVRFYRVFHAWDLRHARADHSRWDGAMLDNCSGVWVNTETGQPIKASFGATHTTLEPLPPVQDIADGRTHIHTDVALRADTYTWDSWRWDNTVQLLDVYEGIAAIDTTGTDAPPALPVIGYAPGLHGAYSADTTTAAAGQPTASDTETHCDAAPSPYPRRGWTGQWDATPWRTTFPSTQITNLPD